MPLCIYCKIDKSKDNFTGREHVIPQAFGKFEPINFFLNENDKLCVCDHCNSSFGSHIDRWLAKDTFEGYVLRGKYFNKKEPSRRIRTFLTVADGQYKGLILEFSGRDTLTPVKQLGFLKHDGSWEYFTLDKLSKFDKDNYNLPAGGIRAYRVCDEEIKKALKDLGIAFKDYKSNLMPPASFVDLLCHIEAEVDEVICRAISKIAFNYFAYFNSPEILLKDDFDYIRNYITRGDGKVPIQLSNKPILFDESRYGRLGHLVTIEKNLYGNIVAQVSLFNLFKYTVFIGRFHGSASLQVGFGHYFDIGTSKISEISTCSILIPKIEIIKPVVKLWLPGSVI